MASRMMTFVALLRGVNVGGNNMISMASLKADFTKLGFQEVTSYINSGNILFKARESDPRKLERKIEAMLAKTYQLLCRVVVRSLPEMKKLVDSLPRTWNGDARWRYNVIFLRHTIDSEEIVATLAPKPDVEQVVYRPGTLLWSAKVTDVTRTTMVKLSSKKIFQDMTVRNLNTAKKLYDLMKRMHEPGRSAG
jgi:uncharacterized protein (DUF1697 family)